MVGEPPQRDLHILAAAAGKELCQEANIIRVDPVTSSSSTSLCGDQGGAWGELGEQLTQVLVGLRNAFVYSPIGISQV